LDRRVGFEANGIAPVAQIAQRNSSRADRAAFQAILIKTDGAKMLAVAAVLPLKLNWSFGPTGEIQLAQYVPSISTLDWSLPRSQESSFVLGTEYFHFRYSL